MVALSRNKKLDKSRQKREERIKDLLPDEREDDILGRAYDGRLVRRLLGYLGAMQGATLPGDFPDDHLLVAECRRALAHRAGD